MGAATRCWLHSMDLSDESSEFGDEELRFLLASLAGTAVAHGLDRARELLGDCILFRSRLLRRKRRRRKEIGRVTGRRLGLGLPGRPTHFLLNLDRRLLD